MAGQGAHSPLFGAQLGHTPAAPPYPCSPSDWQTLGTPNRVGTCVGGQASPEGASTPASACPLGTWRGAAPAARWPLRRGQAVRQDGRTPDGAVAPPSLCQLPRRPAPWAAPGHNSGSMRGKPGDRCAHGGRGTWPLAQPRCDPVPHLMTALAQVSACLGWARGQ